MTSQQAAERVPAVLSLDLIRKADEFLDDEKNRTEFIEGGKTSTDISTQSQPNGRPEKRKADR